MKKGTKVIYDAAPIEGVVTGLRFNEDVGEVTQVRVAYTQGGESHERWFDKADPQLKVVEADDAAH